MEGSNEEDKVMQETQFPISTVECQECLRCTFDGTGQQARGRRRCWMPRGYYHGGVGGVSDCQGEGQASIDSTYQGSGTLQWSSSLRP